jgi:putative peptide zinc metalloprotease protein
MRPDLVIERAAGDRWVVLDPVALRYFELRDAECAVLRMLDGRIDFAELRGRFERLFAPLRLSAPMLESFLHRLHEYGLVLADAPGQGQVWESRRRAATRRAWWLALANPLAIRLPAVRAADAVAALASWFGWLFAPLAVCSAAVAIGWAAVVAATHSETLARELPRVDAQLAGTATVWWLATLAVVKCCHELGHALLLARWGGRVHAVGAMLFVFAPALYCDVSDAWRLRSQWRRAAVAMAGIWVELLLAAAAVAVWRMTEPGLWHSLALKTMVVCTIGTLFFNANPLVRGDAYYVLADLAGMPNLSAEARRALWRTIRDWLGGRAAGNESDPDEVGGVGVRLALAAYGLLSLGCLAFFYWTAIRWTASFLRPSGLSDLSKLLAFMVVAGAAGPPAVAAVRRWRSPVRKRPWRWRRLAVAGVVFAALASIVWLVPMPRRVWAPICLELSSSQPVYVTVPGTLVWCLPAGSRVNAGDPIARLENERLTAAQQALAGELMVQELRVAQLKVRLASDPSLTPLMPVEDERLRGLKERQVRLSSELDRLVLRAERAGVIVETPRRWPGRVASSGYGGGGIDGLTRGGVRQLRDGRMWDGSPFESRNLGCFLDVGTALCEVGEWTEFEGQAWIALVDLPGVRAGQTAKVRWNAAPAVVLSGTVSDVARSAVARGDAARRHAALGQPWGLNGSAGAGGGVGGGATHRGGGALESISVAESAEAVSYEARIAFAFHETGPLTSRSSAVGAMAREVDSEAVPLVLPGASGWACIEADWEPLGKRLWRAFGRTFKE